MRAATVLLAAVLAVSACSHAPPIVAPLTTCGGKIVTAQNAERIATDLETGNDADLVAFAVSEGWPFVTCLISWYEQNGSAAQKASVARFKAGHVEARGGQAMNVIEDAHAYASPDGSLWSADCPNGYGPVAVVFRYRDGMPPQVDCRWGATQSGIDLFGALPYHRPFAELAETDPCDAVCGKGAGLTLSGGRCVCWDRRAEHGRGAWRKPDGGRI
jgi:hypothetical protein